MYAARRPPGAVHRGQVHGGQPAAYPVACSHSLFPSDHAIFTGLFHGKDFLYTCKGLEIYQNNWMGFQGGGPVFPKDRMPQQYDSNMA